MCFFPMVKIENNRIQLINTVSAAVCQTIKLPFFQKKVYNKLYKYNISN